MGKSRPEIGLWYKNRQRLRKRGAKVPKAPPHNIKPLPPCDTYGARDAILLSMGYESYAHYLAGALWHGIRTQCLQMHDRKCVLCDKNADVVHHRRYTLETLQGKDFGQLIPLCNECHEKVEFKKNGSKRELREAQAHINYLLMRKKKK